MKWFGNNVKLCRECVHLLQSWTLACWLHLHVLPAKHARSSVMELQTAGRKRVRLRNNATAFTLFWVFKLYTSPLALEEHSPQPQIVWLQKMTTCEPRLSKFVCTLMNSDPSEMPIGQRASAATACDACVSVRKMANRFFVFIFVIMSCTGGINTSFVPQCRSVGNASGRNALEPVSGSG